MLKFKKIAAILLTAATITGCTASLNGVQAMAANKNKANVTENKKELKIYNSTAALEDSNLNMKFIANAKFFVDPFDNKRTVFLSTDGSFIKSGVKQQGSYWYGSMNWPSGYECSIEIKDEANSGGKTEIVSSTPTNTIKSSRVSNTMGYSVGGVVGVTSGKPMGNINASFNHSQNISYDQENFTTVQDENNLHKVNWKVQFDSTPDGYDRYYKTHFYGNEMYMKSRLSNAGNENLTSIDKLPSLISGGFSPNFLVALKAPKNKSQSLVEITFKKHMDFYEIKWARGRNWYGSNSYDCTKQVVKKFVIDWKKHTIKSFDEVQKEKETKELKELVTKLNNEYSAFMNSSATTPEEIAIQKRVEDLEAKNKITRTFEDNESETKILPDGGVIIGGKWVWELVK
ncbi:leukocidin family pore-forming toxin [Clostridium tarantellae]|uniref:Leukocidin/Hemolysin toxin domain-containing protein n=1 Tax=Clostridium tarantellae TaxID=39493 RepID=A0A6I1MK91_9CLOT|nr:leukocidin family pore-forming toxin [Clostridium tarantellae]MPQ43805.1 hypothetical protein [Clostridium tarantellae]